ncbi:hypothetical protein H0H93_005852 [Arthromyces matolae]|nr:hypothetical protein H0H93_005852 [Arthromyces matolae]
MHDFLLEPLSFDSSPIGNLNLSSTNDPIREHKESLIQIQTELNCIPECDDTRVRMSLKKAVDKVEEALLKLENEVSRRVQEWRTRNSRVRGLHAERPMPQASRQSAATPFSESFLHIDGHPIYPVVSSDIAQLIGDDPRLHTTFLDISSEISRVQVQRLDSLTNGRSTHELDDSLRVIYRNWEEFIRSLIIVKRSEERNGLALLGWRTGEGDLPPVLEAENDVDEDQAHYLSLVLDPNKTDS